MPIQSVCVFALYCMLVDFPNKAAYSTFYMKIIIDLSLLDFSFVRGHGFDLQVEIRSW